MSLSTLPHELLFEIVERLPRSSLNALIRTSRQLYALLNTTLYSNDVRHDNCSALFWAAKTGICSTAQLVIDEGADLQVIFEEEQDTRVGLSLLKTQENLVRSTKWSKRLNSSPRMTFQTCGETPLHRAAMLNHEAVVRCLLDNGADMLAINLGGYYPIQLAAKAGHEAVVSQFLEKGFKPDEMSWGYGEPTALHSALDGGHSAVVKILLEHGASPNSKASWPPCCLAPLQAAIRLGRFGEEESALLLIENGAQLTTLHGESKYLIQAVEAGWVKVVQALLDFGCDPDDCLNGRTALDYAKRHRYKEMIRILESVTTPTAKRKRTATAQRKRTRTAKRKRTRTAKRQPTPTAKRQRKSHKISK
ncbi:ankyrin [Penicillium canariense]|uniref:Ankyrin n=1 Tax=Penicillium canariense TaxID=189055 RepID=A0A9W9LTY7_9EURO|nr:ankyrin [Penicillium canariense]KAJ5175367.1 ankyrin [Penicillium canariense]